MLRINSRANSARNSLAGRSATNANFIIHTLYLRVYQFRPLSLERDAEQDYFAALCQSDRSRYVYFAYLSETTSIASVTQYRALHTRQLTKFGK